MKINPVKIYNSQNNHIKNLNNKSVSNISREEFSSSKYSNYYSVPFKAIPLEKLYNEYNWYIRADHVSAIESFLKMTQPKEVLNEFLTHILSTKDRGYEFIDSIASSPRNSLKYADALREKLGANSSILMTFMPNSPYNIAYTDYITDKYNNATSLMELLKIRPDWKESALLEKQKQLGGPLTIGKIPRQVGKDHLYRIIDYLKDKMEIGVKPNKKINDLILDGKKYEFKYFTEGKSSKNVFGLFVPSEAKKYVIKMEPISAKSFDAPFALGTLAKIDGYLTFNRSRNSAPMCFYDYENNFSLYKYIEHAHVKENPHNIDIIRQKLPDFRILGLTYNDTVGYKNFFVLNEKSIDTPFKMEGFTEALPRQEWISVDNDHVTYDSKLHPDIRGLNNRLPNGMQICV